MPISKVTQLTATVINYPYLEKEHPVAIPVPLFIESAIYYNPDNRAEYADVEPFLSKLIVNNRLEFIVENELFGGNRADPESVTKSVSVELALTLTDNNGKRDI